MPINVTTLLLPWLLLSSLIVGGCATTLPLTPTTAAKLRGREITLAKRRTKPDFAAQTPGKAMFGMLGALAMISAGNDIVASNGVEDPAPLIGQALSAELARRYGTAVSAAPIMVTDDDDDVMSGRGSRADLVLDVSTLNWSFIYFPLSWGHYRVLYGARLRLIDRKTAQVVAEGRCSRIPDETPTAPSYDELLANRAQRLKEELLEAAKFCVSDLEAKLLSSR